jgi:hypothetical protein
MTMDVMERGGAAFMLVVAARVRGEKGVAAPAVVVKRIHLFL